MKLLKLAAVILLVAFLMLIGEGEQRRLVAAQGFDICLQDDADRANALQFNSQTGEYKFCAGVQAMSGRASVRREGASLTLEQTAADRRLLARVDTASKTGTASIQSPGGKSPGTISDQSTGDSSCACR